MSYDDAQAWKDVQENFPNMAIRYVFILKKGPEWSPASTPEIDELQKAHLANYARLAAMGKLFVTGPFLDAFAIIGDVRGMGVLNAASWDEARELISTDPMVKVGRLTFELHAWMIEKTIFT
jgi:uncharacterized protein YciI